MIKYILILIILLSLSACSNKPVSESQFLIGTLCKISIYQTGYTSPSKKETISKAFSRVAEFERKVSVNMLGTEADEINKLAGISKVKVSDDTFLVIKKGIEYGFISKGAFDISVGSLVSLWRIGFPEARVPEYSEIEEAITYINYNDIELNEEDKTVFLKNKGMKLDLGGIAKGFAADEAVKVLRENGVKNAILDFGGNIYAIGKKEGKPWKIGIQDPDAQYGGLAGVIEISDKSVVTSGLYEKYIEKNGIIYHHILNPFTGYPYENDLLGVSIISESSTDCDAIATAVFAQGLEGGIALVESIPHIDAVLISKNREIYISSGIVESFTKVNDAYTIIHK